MLGNGRSKLYGNYGRFFARIPNDLAARALSADDGVTRGDYFDANLTQPIPNGVARRRADQPLRAGRRRRRRRSTRTPSCPTRTSSSPASSARRAEHQPRRALHPPQHRPRARGRGRRAGGGLRPRPARPEQRRVHPHQPGRELPGSATPSSARQLRGSRAHLQRGRVHGRPPLQQQLVADGVSYRWSRLHGSFEGFFREDNGQSDPGITSLYDFPTNDPSYTAIGGPQFGYQGDIRYLGALGAGPLPLDRPHQFKIVGNRAFDNGLSAGRRLQHGLGQAADRARGAVRLRQHRRGSADPARRRLRDPGRLPGADAVRVPVGPAGVLRAELRQRSADPAGRRLQPVQPATHASTTTTTSTSRCSACRTRTSARRPRPTWPASSSSVRSSCGWASATRSDAPPIGGAAVMHAPGSQLPGACCLRVSPHGAVNQDRACRFNARNAFSISA